MFVTNVVGVVDRTFLVSNVAHGGEGYKEYGSKTTSFGRKKEGGEKELVEPSRIPVGLYTRLSLDISTLTSFEPFILHARLHKHVTRNCFGIFRIFHHRLACICAKRRAILRVGGNPKTARTSHPVRHLSPLPREESRVNYTVEDGGSAPRNLTPCFRVFFVIFLVTHKGQSASRCMDPPLRVHQIKCQSILGPPRQPRVGVHVRLFSQGCQLPVSWILSGQSTEVSPSSCEPRKEGALCRDYPTRPYENLCVNGASFLSGHPATARFPTQTKIIRFSSPGSTASIPDLLEFDVIKARPSDENSQVPAPTPADHPSRPHSQPRRCTHQWNQRAYIRLL